MSDIFERLAQSPFRSQFHLTDKDRAYIAQKTMPVIAEHAADFIAKRLAPADIPNDGKQTPMRGHPVFIAQHATATCCRGCLYKWHHIPRHIPLSEQQQKRVTTLIMAWIEKEIQKHPG